MKALTLALSLLLVGTNALAQPTGLVTMSGEPVMRRASASSYADWANNAHHKLIDCAMFYNLAARRSSNEPRLSAALQSSSDLASHYISLLEFRPEVNQARMELWAADAVQNLGYAGGFSILMNRHLDSCKAYVVGGGFVAEARSFIR